MGTISAGVTQNVIIEAGDVLSVSGVANVEINGQIISVSSVGRFGPFDTVTTATIMATSQTSFSSFVNAGELIGGGTIFDDYGNRILGLTNVDGSVELLAKDSIPSQYAYDKERIFNSNTSKRMPRLADGIIATYVARIIAAGDTITDLDISLMRDPLERLVRGSAFMSGKLRELWFPLGTSATTGALVKILNDATAPTSMTAVNLVSGDYTRSTGITGNATNKALNTGFNPTTAGCTANSWGFGIYALKNTPSGVLGGTITGSNSYISFTDTSTNINTVALTNTIQYPRFSSVQVNTSSAEMAYSGFNHASVTYSSGTLPNVNLALLTANSGNYSNQSVTGFAAWSPALTETEKLELAIFFDSMAVAFGRKGFANTLTTLGDSNTRGLGLSSPSTERWSYLLSQKLRLSDGNAGIDDTLISDNGNGGGVGNWVAGIRVTRACLNAGILNIVSLGTNDAQYAVSSANFEADYDTWLGMQFKAGFDPSQFILCSPLAATNALTNQSILIEFREIVKKLAFKYGCGFHDDYALTSGQTSYFQADKLHLNATGHIAKANSLANLIASSSSPCAPERIAKI